MHRIKRLFDRVRAAGARAAGAAVRRLVPVSAFVAVAMLVGFSGAVAVFLAPDVAFAQAAAAAEPAAPGMLDGLFALLQTQLPAWAMVVIVLVRQIAEAVGKLIPDTATGGWGVVRKIAKLLAIYIPNRTR